MRKEKMTNCQLADWIPDQINGYHINCYQMELLYETKQNRHMGFNLVEYSVFLTTPTTATANWIKGSGDLIVYRFVNAHIIYDNRQK